MLIIFFYLVRYTNRQGSIELPFTSTVSKFKMGFLKYERSEHCLFPTEKIRLLHIFLKISTFIFPIFGAKVQIGLSKMRAKRALHIFNLKNQTFEFLYKISTYIIPTFFTLVKAFLYLFEFSRQKYAYNVHGLNR